MIADCHVTLVTPCSSRPSVSWPGMAQASSKRTIGSPWPTAWPTATQTSRDRAGARRLDAVVHLHRVEHRDLLAAHDAVAGLDGDVQDHARHRCGQRARDRRRPAAAVPERLRAARPRRGRRGRRPRAAPVAPASPAPRAPPPPRRPPRRRPRSPPGQLVAGRDRRLGQVLVAGQRHLVASRRRRRPRSGRPRVPATSMTNSRSPMSERVASHGFPLRCQRWFWRARPAPTQRDA